MSSRLHDKINSYAIEKGIEMSTSTFPWPETGTEPQTTLANWTLSTNSPSYTGEGCGGGKGSQYWYFNTARRYLMNFAGSIGASYLDANYSLGFWFKVNNWTYTPGSTANIFGVLPVPNSGFTVNLVSNAAGNPEYDSIVVSFPQSPTFYLIPFNDPNEGYPDAVPREKWHYFAAVRNGTSMDIYMDGQFKTTITNFITGVNPTRILFGNNAQSGVSPVYRNYNLSNYYVAPASVIGPTEIAEIWEAGKTMTTPIKYWDGTNWTTTLDISRYAPADGTASALWHDVNAQVWDGDSWNTL